MKDALDKIIKQVPDQLILLEYAQFYTSYQKLDQLSVKIHQLMHCVLSFTSLLLKWVDLTVVEFSR